MSTRSAQERETLARHLEALGFHVAAAAVRHSHNEDRDLLQRAEDALADASIAEGVPLDNLALPLARAVLVGVGLSPAGGQS